MKIEFTKPTRKKKARVETIQFDIDVNGRVYTVNATPFKIATGDTLFRVSYNNGPVHEFAWDEGLDRYAENTSVADLIPPVIEMAIASRLREEMEAWQKAA